MRKPNSNSASDPDIIENKKKLKHYEARMVKGVWTALEEVYSESLVICTNARLHQP